MSIILGYYIRCPLLMIAFQELKLRRGGGLENFYIG